MSRYLQLIGISLSQEDFDATDMFLGYHEDTLTSLVLHHSTSEEVLDKCKRDLISCTLVLWVISHRPFAPLAKFFLFLLFFFHAFYGFEFDIVNIMIATADGIVRALSSSMATSTREESEKWKDLYFANQLHQSLLDFAKFISGTLPPLISLLNLLLLVTDQHVSEMWGGFGDAKGLKAVVMTYSPIHTPILPLVEPLCDAERVQVLLLLFIVTLLNNHGILGLQSRDIHIRKAAISIHPVILL